MSESTDPTPTLRWPGLESFREGDQARFHGRDSEIAELARRIDQRRLTVLFGTSGLGKTSLLRAGVFPKLRKAHLLPIEIRIDHGATAPHPVEQIRTAVSEELGCTFPADSELADWFHDTRQGPAGDVLSGVVPVLVFDQFEEVFTLGQATTAERERSEEFLRQLADLAEARPSNALEAALENGEQDPEHYDFENSSYRLVFSIREDFLSHLERCKQLMPSVMENRQSLDRLRGDKAILAVLGPGEGIVDPHVAEAIVRFVSGGGDAPIGQLHVEPPLLSLVCQQLDIQRGEGPITAELLQGKREEIISNYYQSCFQGLPAHTQAAVEDHLVTESGYRENIATETLERQIGAAPLSTLIRRRLVHTETRNGISRVELTHDVLTRIITATRASRRERDALVRQHQQANDQRRRKLRTLAIAALALISIALTATTGFAIRQTQIAQTQSNIAAKEEKRANRERDIAEVEQKKAESARAEIASLLEKQEILSNRLQQTADSLTLASSDLASVLIGENQAAALGTTILLALIPKMETLQVAIHQAGDGDAPAALGLLRFRLLAAEAYGRADRPSEARAKIASARPLLNAIDASMRDLCEAELLILEGEIEAGTLVFASIVQLDEATYNRLTAPWFAAIDLLRHSPTNTDLALQYQWRWLQASNLIARMMRAAKMNPEAMQRYRENLESCDRQHADHFHIRRMKAEALNGIGILEKGDARIENARSKQAELLQAIESLNASILIREDLIRERPDHLALQQEYAFSLSNLGAYYLMLFSATRSEAHYQRSMEIRTRRLNVQRKLYESDPGNQMFANAYASAIATVISQEISTPGRSARPDRETIDQWLKELNRATVIAPDVRAPRQAQADLMRLHAPNHPDQPSVQKELKRLSAP